MTVVDDLRQRFRRIDRLTAPDLWAEAVGRAGASDTTAQWRPVPSVVGVLLVGLLVALLAGAMVMGLFQRPETRVDERLIAVTDCTLVLASLDGDAQRPLVGDARHCVDAQLRLDAGGGRLAFTTSCGPCFGFESAGTQWAGFVDASNGEAHELDVCGPSEGQCLADISISQDGHRIAYGRWNVATRSTELELIDLERDERRTVSLAVLPFSRPAWTPDGEAVIVAASAPQEGAPGRLSRVAFDGGATPIVDAAGSMLSTVDIAPDGRSIAYLAVPVSRGPPELRRSSIDGTTTDTLAVGTRGSTFIGVAWSSDGTRIAVTEVPIEMMSERLTIRVVDVESGAETTPYETDDVCCEFVAPATWSPDGQTLRLALVTDPGVRGTYAIPADGNGPVQLLTEELAVGWLPDR